MRYVQSGTAISPSTLQALETAFGISNKPLYLQYFQYIDNLFHGNLGLSFGFWPTPVATIIQEALPWTLYLVVTATVVSFFLGNRLGVMAATRRLKRTDVALSSVFMFFQGFPAFTLAFILILVLCLRTGLFPAELAYSPAFHKPALSLPFVASALYYSAVPLLTIILTSLAGWLFGMRNNFLPTLGSDFTTYYEAMGLKKSRIEQLAYRVAFLPNLTGFALALGFSVTGVLAIEYVFSYPGMGFFLYQAVVSLDYTLLQGIVLVLVVTMILANAVVEILYGVIDPRIKQEAK
jgi:peptide/nickel transport system permease protein